MKAIKITNEKFYNPTMGGFIQPQGKWCLLDDKGYVGFKDDPYIPYFPRGGKRALDEILTSGGFTNEDDIVFIQPTKG